MQSIHNIAQTLSTTHMPFTPIQWSGYDFTISNYWINKRINWASHFIYTLPENKEHIISVQHLQKIPVWATFSDSPCMTPYCCHFLCLHSSSSSHCSSNIPYEQYALTFVLTSGTVKTALERKVILDKGTGNDSF